MANDDEARGIGLNEIVYTATIAIDEHDEARYEVRYTGCSGDGTLHFRVRRRVVAVKTRMSTSIPNFPLPPSGGAFPREWECFVPLRDDGTATARWWFGDDAESKRVDHYKVGSDNDLFFLDSPSTMIRGRIGYRQGDSTE